MVIISKINVPEEALVYMKDNIKLIIDGETLGTGILYITESSLSWKPDGREDGITIAWQEISLHGVTNVPERSIYLMLDFHFKWQGLQNAPAQGNGNGNVENENIADNDEDEGNESDSEEPRITELWFIAQSPEVVDNLFQLIKEYQMQTSINANSDSASDEMDLDSGENDDSEEVGQRNMSNLHLDDKFEDAEE